MPWTYAYMMMHCVEDSDLGMFSCFTICWALVNCVLIWHWAPCCSVHCHICQIYKPLPSCTSVGWDLARPHTRRCALQKMLQHPQPGSSGRRNVMTVQTFTSAAGVIGSDTANRRVWATWSQRWGRCSCSWQRGLELDDLKDHFQPKAAYDSMILCNWSRPQPWAHQFVF